MKFKKEYLLLLFTLLFAACSAKHQKAEPDFTEEMGSLETAAVSTASAATQQADECEVYTSAFSFTTVKNMTLKVFRPAEGDIATYTTDANCTASVTSTETIDKETKAMLIKYGVIKCNFGESSQDDAVFSLEDNVLISCESVPTIETIDPYESLDINGEQLLLWEGRGDYNITSTLGWVIPSGEMITLNGHDDKYFHVLYGDMPLDVPIELVRFSRP